MPPFRGFATWRSPTVKSDVLCMGVEAGLRMRLATESQSQARPPVACLGLHISASLTTYGYGQVPSPLHIYELLIYEARSPLLLDSCLLPPTRPEPHALHLSSLFMGMGPTDFIACFQSPDQEPGAPATTTTPTIPLATRMRRGAPTEAAELTYLALCFCL